MFLHHSQRTKRISRGALALLFLGFLLTTFLWTPKAHAAAADSVLALNVNPYPTPFTVYEVGSTMSQVVATGTDALGPGDPITATIDWGDKTTPTQYTFIDGRDFQVAGSHAYSKVGTYTITVTAAITAFQQSVSGTGTINVVPAYTLNVKNINPVAGRTFNGIIATGTDPFFNDPLNGTIDWGDNTAPTSVQVTSSANGAYQVKAAHTYTTYSPTGNWTITVSLNSTIVGPISATGTAALVPAFTLSANPINARAGQLFQGKVATISGTISAGGARVNIEWGDGTITKLMLPAGTGTVKVKTGHVYAQAGTYHLLIGTRDYGTGEQAVVGTTATVV